VSSPHQNQVNRLSKELADLRKADGEGFVRELAQAFRDREARVWYDEFTLKVGDSLRRTIDRGLASSRFGVVVLSDSFFQKEWPNRELDGLVALDDFAPLGKLGAQSSR